LIPLEKFSIHLVFLFAVVKDMESHFRLPPQAAMSLAAIAQAL
jgi:hypothetical protein